MPRTLTPEELEIVRETEAKRDKRPPAVRAGDTTLQAGPGHVKLFDPKGRAIKFGTGTMSQNGPFTTDTMIVLGSIEPGVAIVRADHPLLEKFRRRYPEVVVLEEGEQPGKSWACDECDQEFRTKARLRAHRQSAHRPEPAEKPKAAAAPRPVARGAAAGKGREGEPPPGVEQADADEA